MKKLFLLFSMFFAIHGIIMAQIIEKTYTFQSPQIRQAGDYQLISFDQTMISGVPGEPALPYQSVALLIPPGAIATSIELFCQDEISLPGTYLIYPQQQVRPLSEGPDGSFLKNEGVYQQKTSYPVTQTGRLLTQYLNGYAFALCSFTPVSYYPATGSFRYFQTVTIRINTRPDERSVSALRNISGSEKALKRIQVLAQNKEVMALYLPKKELKSDYQYLIITHASYENAFQDLIDMYNSKGINCQVATTQTISTSMTGQDLQEKIRNYIIQEYQTNGVEYILLGGDTELVPYRGFYCYVESSGPYVDENIPADLYYSGLDGTWNDNGNSWWGEPEEADLLPDIAVTRFPFSNSTELENMIHKSISYQENPVADDFKQPLMAGEHLYDDPMTFGEDYMELLIDDHTDNGYFTHGIPSEENTFTKLYDTLISLPNGIYNWTPTMLINEINEGKSFIHHLGHSNVNYMLRMFFWDITNQNFSQVNGVDHNYTLLYTQGCLCGAFDENDCIAEKSVTIENFLVAGAFNSRYGWFNQGQTEGPSEHLHREFVSALYNDTISFPRIGETHMMSKIATAPWVTIPGQFEPGAQRWCHYCCNVFGDPAMTIWTDEPSVGIRESLTESKISLYPNPANQLVTIRVPEHSNPLLVTLATIQGQKLATYHIPATKDNSGSQFQIDVSQLSPGIYLVNYIGTHLYGSEKLCIVK